MRRPPAKYARGDGKSKGKKEGLPDRKINICREEFEVGGFMAEKVLEDRDALLKEDGNQLRELQAIHEPFFSRQLAA